MRQSGRCRIPFHVTLAVAAAVGLALLVVASVYAVVVRDYRRILVDRLLLAELGLLLLAAVTGLLVFATSRGLSDPLHLVYGVAVVVALPIARYLGRRGTPRRRGGYLLLGALVSLGLLARLFMTG